MYKSKHLSNWSSDPLYAAAINNNIMAGSGGTGRINVISGDNSIERIKPPSSSNYTNRGSKTYWKWTFVITLVPFYLWGIPVHRLFGKRSITNTKAWLKHLFSFVPNPCSGIVTMFLLLGTIGGDVYLLYRLGRVFYELVILANPNASGNFFPDLKFLGHMIPIAIPINYVWLFGYKIRNLISAFDKIVVPVTRDYYSETPLTVSSSPSGRVKLFIMYVMIITIHTIDEVLKYHHISIDEIFKSQSAIEEWAFTLVDSLYSLMLPLYAALCMAVTYEFQVLAAYIGILMEDNKQAKIELLDDFKRAYKRVADHVLQINQICSLYMSWVFPLLGFGLYNEFFNIWEEFMTVVFTPPTEPPTDIAPSIRSLIGSIFVILLEAIVGIFTLFQAIKANDEARYLHVWLNDFVTTPQANLNQEVYMAFRMLKYYVHSRMEQPKPALLSLTFLSFVPFLKNRMLQYDVRH